MADVATTGDTAIDDEFAPILFPENATIEEWIAILQKDNDAFYAKMEKDLAEDRRRLDELSIPTIQPNEVGGASDTAGTVDDEVRTTDSATTLYQESAAMEERLAAFEKNLTDQFEKIRKEDAANRLATQVATQQGKLEKQEPARREVVSEIELPIGGDQSKALTGESQPYTEAVHGEDVPQNCSSDKKIVSEQILDFSTDQAKYVATDQMPRGQDMAHDHLFDQQKQVHDQFNCDFAAGRHHDHEEDQSKHGQLNYQLSCGLGKPICGFDQEKLATVGDKADFGTSSSPKLQLKIIIRQPTKILGGQDYSSYEPNFSQVFDAKYLCSFPTSSHNKGFHAITFDTAELGVKHRWPPP